MSPEQLREVWIGNTLYASYPDDGEIIEVRAHAHPDGTVYGRGGKHGEHRSSRDVGDGTCFRGGQDNDKYGGWYFCVHDSGTQ